MTGLSSSRHVIHWKWIFCLWIYFICFCHLLLTFLFLNQNPYLFLVSYFSQTYSLTKINPKRIFHACIYFYQFALKFQNQFFIYGFDSLLVAFIILIFVFSQMHAICQNWIPVSW
jgi:hypothetical protein